MGYMGTVWRGRFAPTLAAAGMIALAATGASAADPDPFPPVSFPAANPQTDAKVLLGRELFWDVQLSSNNTVACGSCHLPEQGGSGPFAANPGADGMFGTADDVQGSIGIHGQTTGRKAPSAVAAMVVSRLFWDGRAGIDFFDPENPAELAAMDAALEDQGTKPQLGASEMAFEGRTWTEILAKLSTLNGPETGMPYPTLFADAFGDPALTAVRVGFAIAAYERTLVPDQAPVILWGAGGPIPSAAVERGFDVFRGAGRCDKCHDPANAYTDGAFHNIGVTPISDDLGRFNVTGRKKDRGAFKTPTLMNVALQDRFFHNGRFDTLEEVIEFYDRGGDFHDNQDPLIRPLGLTAGEKSDLLAFLDALTDPNAASASGPFTHIAPLGVADPIDMTAPTVSLGSPSLMANFNGIVKFKVDATDDQNVSKVTFQLNGGPILEDIVRPYEFIVDVTGIGNGMVPLNLTAEDFNSNVGNAAEMILIANGGADQIAPEVMIVNPTSKIAVGNPVNGSVPITAAVFDNIGVTEVDYFLDGNPIGTGVAPGFGSSFNSRNFANGPHTLSAIASDAAGNMSAPFAVVIQIDNATPFPVAVLPMDAEGVVGLAGEFTLTGSFRNGSNSFRFVGLALPQPVNGTTFRVVLTSPLGDIALGTVRPSTTTGNVSATLRASGNLLKRGFAAEEIQLFDGPTLVASGLVGVEMLIDGAATVSTRINGLSRSFRTLIAIESTGPGEVVTEIEVTATRIPAGNYIARFEATGGNIDVPFSPDVDGLVEAALVMERDITKTIGTFQRVRILKDGISIGTRTISVR